MRAIYIVDLNGIKTKFLLLFYFDELNHINITFNM